MTVTDFQEEKESLIKDISNIYFFWIQNTDVYKCYKLLLIYEKKITLSISIEYGQSK